MLGEKNDWKGTKKGEKYIFFPQSVKSIHIFYPIDSTFTKLQQKRLKILACGAQLLIIIHFIWGKNINQEGGGGKNMIFKFNIHPCVTGKIVQEFIRIISKWHLHNSRLEFWWYTATFSNRLVKTIWGTETFIIWSLIVSFFSLFISCMQFEIIIL